MPRTLWRTGFRPAEKPERGLCVRKKHIETKRGNVGRRSLFLSGRTLRGSAVGLAGDVCGDDHELRLAVVLGKLHLRLGHWELAAGVTAVRPNLIQEIVVAEPLKYKRCCAGRAGTMAHVSEGDTLLGLVCIVDANG